MVEYSVELQESCFAFLEKHETEILLEAMESIFFAAGTLVFEKGDYADCMYFLQVGQVAVQNKTGFGERMQVVALLASGAPVGEKGLLGSLTRGATLVAVKDSKLLALSQEAFNTLVVESPDIAIKLLKWLLTKVSLRLEKNSERLTHVL
jgi:CRP-like cAMP-binding protein